jgi:hypothetical protein
MASKIASNRGFGGVVSENVHLDIFMPLSRVIEVSACFGSHGLARA